MSGGPKKWFMLQMWRFQQVSQIATLALLALNLSLQVYNFVSWRGSVFESPYTAVPLILLILVAGIWAFAIFWDMRMKMWREQMAVAMERNPYAKERMYSKELVIYSMLWLPMLEHMGEKDPKLKESADHLRAWLKKAYDDDKSLRKETGDILRYMGTESDDIFGLLKK
jgi:hypothetical protein